VIVTLMDFVEEDLSRKLPASERINHTLLALNYGAHPGSAAAGFDRMGRPTCRHRTCVSWFLEHPRNDRRRRRPASAEARDLAASKRFGRD